MNEFEKIITLEDLEEALKKEDINGKRRRNFFNSGLALNYEFEKIPGSITIVFDEYRKKLLSKFQYNQNGFQDIEKNSGKLLKVFGEENDSWASIVYATLPFPFNEDYSREMNSVLNKIYKKEGWIIVDELRGIAPKSNYIAKKFDGVHYHPLPTAQDLIKTSKEIISIYSNLEKVKDKLPGLVNKHISGELNKW
jgi:hypothetical protein